jgi:hypothetical protein
MDLIVLVVGLCALGVLANRFGYDSRDVLGPKESELAARGYKWANPPTRAAEGGR